jgi:hypothetical protein
VRYLDIFISDCQPSRVMLAARCGSLASGCHTI